MNTPNYVLIQYIRNNHGQPRGCVVATGRNQVGWSLCNKKDIFNKERALQIAMGRVKISRVVIPQVVQPYFVKMIGRSQRYFKD